MIEAINSLNQKQEHALKRAEPDDNDPRHVIIKALGDLLAQVLYP